MIECQAAGIQFYEPGSDSWKQAHCNSGDQDDDGDVKMTVEDADQQYARRLQAKMDAARYATEQRGYDLVIILQCPCGSGERISSKFRHEGVQSVGVHLALPWDSAESFLLVFHRVPHL